MLRLLRCGGGGDKAAHEQTKQHSQAHEAAGFCTARRRSARREATPSAAPRAAAPPVGHPRISAVARADGLCAHVSSFHTHARTYVHTHARACAWACVCLCRRARVRARACAASEACLSIRTGSCVRHCTSPARSAWSSSSPVAGGGFPLFGLPTPKWGAANAQVGAANRPSGSGRSSAGVQARAGRRFQSRPRKWEAARRKRERQGASGRRLGASGRRLVAAAQARRPLAADGGLRGRPDGRRRQAREDLAPTRRLADGVRAPHPIALGGCWTWMHMRYLGRRATA